MRIDNYEEQVYAGVLGKVIGVYMGRPFEGWPKERLVERWGLVDRYVHEDVDKPLVVADDDITGTFTFVRILRDGGGYADTPVERFGDNWLNYIVLYKSILWWGGFGYSTEHTAFVRLMDGIKAPRSGSIELNGRTVAEQIGAQIFIDAFGMVAPGRPELAAELARRAASVSHDGEAVNGAVVVASMVSAAFVEKNMDTLLDIGAEAIPSDSVIAQVHRDVRAWCRQDGDWEKTYDRIRERYGYDTYGGGCHMVPNHAIMVMAWCYAPDDFQMSQAIINTAGWDTDCNAANVGSVMGVKLGLAGINANYDFQGPFADRMVLPTAEGTRGVSDCLNEALEIAAVGRKVMGWDEIPRAKGGALFHFSLPGALHGFMSEDDNFMTRGAAAVSHATGPEGASGMRIEARDLCRGRPARVSTPMLARRGGSGYGIMGTPRLYSGMHATLHGRVEHVRGDATARLFVRTVDPQTRMPSAVAYGEPVALREGMPVELRMVVPDTGGWPVCDLGVELSGTGRAAASLFVDTVDIGGTPHFSIADSLPTDSSGAILGWIVDIDNARNNMGYRHPYLQAFGRNKGRGHLAVGTTDWADYTFETDLVIHCADQAGIMVRYQGLRRYVALLFAPGVVRLVRVCYEEQVLGEKPLAWEVDEAHTVKAVATGDTITFFVDGKRLFEHAEQELHDGGVGFVVETGVAGMRRMRVGPVEG